MENYQAGKPKRNKLWTWLLIISIALSFVLGLFIGKIWDIKNGVLNEDGSVDVVKVLDLYSQTRSSEVDFNQFWEVWDKVKEKYVDQPVDDVELFYGALQGILVGLDDPYSVYFPPKKAEEFAKDLAGEFEGIGAEIGLRDNQLTIIAPLPSSPAEKAGLRPGDKVYAVDKEDVFDLTLDEAVSKIRGPKGTEVILTISHDGYEGIEDISIIRDTITVPTIDWEMKDNNIAYLRVSYFNEDTWAEFDTAVNNILLNSPKGLVLDLRSNPGGYLETAVSVASEWIDQGVVMKEKTNSESKDYKTRGKHRLVNLPTVVLVDEGTASGSEIVAGALQDYDKATLVGHKTYGKGSVQEFEILLDGSALKLTTAKWFTPKDRGIDETGIEPDIIVEEMFVELEQENEEGLLFDDLALEKALEILN